VYWETIVLVLTPFVFTAAFIIDSVSGERLWRKINLTGSLVLIFLGLLYLFTYFYEHAPREHIILYSVPGLGETYGLIIDPLSAGFAGIISLVAGLIMLYGTEYMSPGNNYHPVFSGFSRYFAWMYFFTGSVLLFVFSSSLLMLLINFELMSLACWGLISYYGGREAERSSYKMLIITHLGAYGGLAAAIGYVLSQHMGLGLSTLSSLTPYSKLVVLGLVMWAAVTKSSQFPTYSWLPDAMVAPTPTSALLHGATMIEMGPYLVARIIYSMKTVPVPSAYIILVPATLSLLVASTIYPGLRDGKKLLAYSTVAEAAIMYYAVSLMIVSPGLGMSLFYLYFTVHAFLKSTGFLVMGSAGYAVGTHGLERVMEALSNDRLLSSSLIAVLFGLAGVPVYSVSKIYLLIKSGVALHSSAYIAGFIAILVESLSIALVSMKWINKLSHDRSEDLQVPLLMKLAIALLLIGLYVSQAYCFLIALPVIMGAV